MTEPASTGRRRLPRWYHRLAGLAWRGIGVPHVGAISMLTFFGSHVPFIGATLFGMLAVGVVALSELRAAGYLGHVET